MTKKEFIRWRRIGIIGGHGPRASAHFYGLVVDLCSQKYHAIQDSDYPFIVLVSLHDEGVSEAGDVDKAVLLPEIERALAFFGTIGVSAVAIVCNSVYAYVDEFPQQPRIQIVNLPEELALAVSKLHAKDIAIVCSRSLSDSRAYDPYFLANGIRLRYPEESLQALIDHWILEVMGARYTDRTVTHFWETLNRLASQHDAVVLACTELPVLVGSALLPPNVIDSSRVLAEALLGQASS